MQPRSHAPPLLLLLLLLALSACSGSPPPAATPLPPTATIAPSATPLPPTPTPAPTDTPEPTVTVLASAPEMDRYTSSNDVFYMDYPAGWALREVVAEDGALAFAIAPSEAQIDGRPDFREPVAFAFGSQKQVEPALADPSNLPALHERAFANHPLFALTPHGEPTITRPSPYVTYYVMEARSQEPDGTPVRWMIATALADRTVLHFGVGVSESGMASLGQVALGMFNSVEVDTEVTGALAGGQ